MENRVVALRTTPGGAHVAIARHNHRAPGYQDAQGRRWCHSDQVCLHRTDDLTVGRRLPVRNAESLAMVFAPEGHLLAMSTCEEVILYVVPEDFRGGPPRA